MFPDLWETFPSLDLKKNLSVGQKLQEQRCDLFELLVRNESLLKYRDVTPPKSRQEMDVCWRFPQTARIFQSIPCLWLHSTRPVLLWISVELGKISVEVKHSTAENAVCYSSSKGTCRENNQMGPCTNDWERVTKRMVDFDHFEKVDWMGPSTFSKGGRRSFLLIERT